MEIGAHIINMLSFLLEFTVNYLEFTANRIVQMVFKKD